MPRTGSPMGPLFETPGRSGMGKKRKVALEAWVAEVDARLAELEKVRSQFAVLFGSGSALLAGGLLPLQSGSRLAGPGVPPGDLVHAQDRRPHVGGDQRVKVQHALDAHGRVVDHPRLA